jgi:hypothetical protein
VSLQSIVAALADYWPQTLPYLQPAELDLIGRMIDLIDADPADEDSVLEISSELEEALFTRLPSGHPVREAIFAQARFASVPPDWPQMSAALRTLLNSLGRADDTEERLLAAPAISVQQVIEHGDDPQSDGLIRLPSPDGGLRLPAFQFGADGHPIQVVLRINRILEARDDPWGVADWWLGGNAWLDGIPAALIGHVGDDLLTMAARAELNAG